MCSKSPIQRVFIELIKITRYISLSVYSEAGEGKNPPLHTVVTTNLFKKLINFLFEKKRDVVNKVTF